MKSGRAGPRSCCTSANLMREGEISFQPRAYDHYNLRAGLPPYLSANVKRCSGRHEDHFASAAYHRHPEGEAAFAVGRRCLTLRLPGREAAVAPHEFMYESSATARSKGFYQEIGQGSG